MGVDYTSGWDVLIATAFDNVNSLLDDAYQSGLIPSSGSGSFPVQPLPDVTITVVIASATVAPWTMSGGTGQNVVINVPFTGGTATIGADVYPLDGVTLQVTANLEFVQSTLSGGTEYQLNLNLSNSSAIVGVKLQVPSSLNVTSENLTALQESLQLLLQQTLAGSGYPVATIDSSTIPAGDSWLVPTQGMEYAAATDSSLPGGGALAVVLATINPPGPQPALVPDTIPSGCDSALIISNEIFTQQFLAPSFASSLNVSTGQITYGGNDPMTATLSGTASVAGAAITSATATANNDSIAISLTGNASPTSGVTVNFTISASYGITLGGTASNPVITFTQNSLSESYSTDIAWWVYLVSGLTLGLIGTMVVAAIQAVVNNAAGTSLSNALPPGFSTSFAWPFSGSVAITTAELPLPLQLGGVATISGTFPLPDGD